MITLYVNYIIFLYKLVVVLRSHDFTAHTVCTGRGMKYFRLMIKLLVNYILNPFTAEVAIMRLLGSAPKSHLCDQKMRSKVTGLSDLMTLFIDLGCLYCKQTQRAFIVFKNTINWLKIDSVDQKFNWLECGSFSQDSGTPGTERVIAFSQLAVKGSNRYLTQAVILLRIFFARVEGVTLHSWRQLWTRES
jgi:hypothetical protein